MEQIQCSKGHVNGRLLPCEVFTVASVAFSACDFVTLAISFGKVFHKVYLWSILLKQSLLLGINAKYIAANLFERVGKLFVGGKYYD